MPMKIELPLRITAAPGKRPVSINEIEIDERFVPDELL